MHIFSVSTTGMQRFKKIHWKLWEELITQTLYGKVWWTDRHTDWQTDGQTDGQTGTNLNASWLSSQGHKDNKQHSCYIPNSDPWKQIYINMLLQSYCCGLLLLFVTFIKSLTVCTLFRVALWLSARERADIMAFCRSCSASCFIHRFSFSSWCLG